ncbi:hypothetical protein [Dietzia psychralcaliphila]|uniref:Uncharacterized protein n=1 Tax=Dietzia psychralcaliphila TaxID=139021 RepID=A0AAD0NNM4_9ACTN|nr:hypothetical protein [Dietzia psychralcaliphila]AWH96940.1 hypothetical protein A6048_17160 [Dietzia psychralcaliphila]PTM89608.1 hypothetical protein C8N39_102451 [Dietzia psychralcaliphila]
MRQETIAEAIRQEFEFTRDWVSIAGALSVLGINDRAATRLEAEAILRCVDETPTLRLGTVRAGFQEIASPLPIADLLDEIFSCTSPSDRVGAMMGYFIDVQPLGGR